MYVDDRIEWNAVIATVLDVDEEFASTPRANLPDRAELHAAVFREHLKAYGDGFLPIRLLSHVSFLPRAQTQRPA
jgi:hypothetical protein